MTGAKIYEKDPKAYYGDVNTQNKKTEEFSVSPKIFPEANQRYERKDIYYLDQKPYYGTGRDYRVITNSPRGMKEVPIQLKELRTTYADANNINSLENDLKRLTEKESLNSISLSGKYFKDPTPYYDPAADERRLKAQTLSNTIENMKNELKENQKGPIFTEENFKIKTKIQNYSNLNREASNEFIKNSYYYEPHVKEGNFILFNF